MKQLKIALLCAIGLASVNAMACYTVYDRNNNVVYNAQTPPVDMSRPIHETVPVAFPGGTMVFGSGTDCPRDMPARVAAPAAPSKPSPLLTDRRTAAALNVPHTILPSGVALISQPTAIMTAGLSTYSTASPAPVMMATATVQQRKPRAETVITELHNPPLTVVQQGGMVVSELR
jgi:hypothetical protein